MLIAITTFIAAVGAGWQSVGGQLLTSGVMLLCGHQDIRLGTRTGAGFWFFMAIAFGISALVTAISARIWWGAAICVVALCRETWLILRWWSRGTSAGGSAADQKND
jgi:hypothetical protein